jgi:O-acetylhomoserine (thiol)-lyase
MQMLELLSLRKGTTLTKEMFLNHLYGGMDEPELKIIDVFICKLRKKLALACGGKNYIETVWGRGYVLRDPITDIERIAEIAHRHGVPLIVDNTVALALPVPPDRSRRRHRRPFADQVHRGPRQLDRRHHRRQRQVPWAGTRKRFKRLNEPDPSYHGVVYTEALGPAAFIGRARVVPLRNMGAATRAASAFLILQGSRPSACAWTVTAKTQKVAKYLRASQGALGQLRRPAGQPTTRWPRRYMGGKASGILSFGVKRAARRRAAFQDR